MRQPTPEHVALAWWSATLAGERPPIHPNEPQSGFFKRRMVRHGPYVAARIWLHQVTDADGDLTEDERLRCEIDGEERDPFQQWSYLAGHPISAADYRYMRAKAAWADANAPMMAVAQPYRAVNWLTAELPF